MRTRSNLQCFAIGFACTLFMLSAVRADELEIRTIPQTLPLPQTYNAKLAGDLNKYIRLQCSGFFTQCDVFVQGNRTGSLIGYLTMRRESDGTVYFESDTLTDDERACIILGTFDGARFNPTEDFEQRSSFQSKTDGRNKKSNGGYLFKRFGEHLRVQDESWNYCYETKHIDDVWNLVGTARRH